MSPVGMWPPLPAVVVSPLVAHSIGTQTGNNTAVTAAVDTTLAKRIYLFVSYFGSGTAPTISDSKSNTWTACLLQASSSQRARLYYCNNPTVGSGHTFTASGTGSFPTLCMEAFSTVVVSGALDINLGAAGASGLVSPATPGATPGHNNEIIVTGTSWGVAGSSAATITGGYAVTDQQNYNGTLEGGAMAYLVQTTAASTNPQWNVHASIAPPGVIASFQA